MRLSNKTTVQGLLATGLVLLLFVAVSPLSASQPTGAQTLMEAQSEQEPKKKGETEGETPTEEDDDEPDC